MANVKMTCQHFELIAATIRATSPLIVSAPERLNVAHLFADHLTATNPNFDRERFIATATREV